MSPTVCHTVCSFAQVVTSQVYAPGRIRTSDQQLRRLLLYPPELRARIDRRQHNTPLGYTTGRHKKNATARIP